MKKARWVFFTWSRMTGTIQLRGNSKSSLLKKKKKTTTCSQLNHFNVNEITPQCLCPCYVHLLVAGDVERHSTQHNFRPHAFNSSSYSQVQLTTEGEMRRGAQVCQRLQGLSRTQHIDIDISLFLTSAFTVWKLALQASLTTTLFVDNLFLYAKCN